MLYIIINDVTNFRFNILKDIEVEDIKEKEP